MKVSKALAVLALCMAVHSASALRQLRGYDGYRSSSYSGGGGSYGGSYDSNTLARYAQCGGKSNRPEYGWGKCSYGDVCKCKDEWYCQCMPPNELPDHAEQRQYGYGQQGSYQPQGSYSNYGKSDNSNYGKSDNSNYGKSDNSNYNQVKAGYRYGYEGGDSYGNSEYGHHDTYGQHDSYGLPRYAQCGGRSNRPEYGWGKCSYGDVCKCKDEWYCQCMPPNELPDHAEQRQYGYSQQVVY